jgi:adenosylcobinamide-GDP ribazoletransferase
MRQFFKELAIGISFYTRVPIRLKSVAENEFYHCMLYMPIIGGFIGALMFAAGWLLGHWQRTALSAVMLLVFYIWITGGLHYDGVADTVDALFSARDRDRMMAIMKDSRLGAFGAIGLVLLLFTMWGSYQILMKTLPVALWLMPVIGRYCAVQACAFSTYAEGGGGLGKGITEMAKPHHALIYLVLIGGLTWWLRPILWLAFGMTAVLDLLLTAYCNRKFAGITGDQIGFTIEITQAIFMVATIAMTDAAPVLAQITGGLLG